MINHGQYNKKIHEHKFQDIFFEVMQAMVKS